MEKNPRNRYQSAAQMLRHLRRLKMDEKTVFNIMKPAPHTNTSEITLRKTARHSHDSHDSQNDQNLAVKKTGSGGLQTKKSPLGTGETTGPTQKPGTSVTNNGGNKSGGNSSGGSKTGGNSSGGNKPIGNNSGRKKKKFNYVTTFLVVIIILLVLAIWGIISLIFSPGNTDQSVFLPHTQDIVRISILYLKQGIL
jgi:hypothetical protein